MYVVHLIFIVLTQRSASGMGRLVDLEVENS